MQKVDIVKDMRRAGEFMSLVLAEVATRNNGSFERAWRVLDRNSNIFARLLDLLSNPHVGGESKCFFDELQVNPGQLPRGQWDHLIKAICEKTTVQQVDSLITENTLIFREWKPRKISGAVLAFDMDTPFCRVREFLRADGWRMAYPEEAVLIANQRPDLVWTQDLGCRMEYDSPVLFQSDGFERRSASVWLPCFILQNKTGAVTIRNYAEKLQAYKRTLSCWKPVVTDAVHPVLPKGIRMILVKLQ
jgi:hypothetical protein